jgi:hypothetical protein
MAEPQPLFPHRRLIAAALVGVLSAVISAALYMRPLSGDTPAAHVQGTATISAVLGVRG